MSYEYEDLARYCSTAAAGLACVRVFERSAGAAVSGPEVEADFFCDYFEIELFCVCGRCLWLVGFKI